VRQVVAVADGAIVGSALIRRLSEKEAGTVAEVAQAAGDFVRELAKGLR